MTGPKKQPCLPSGLHTFIVTGLVQFFFQPSFFLRGNRGRPGLAAATGRYEFCVQMGITSLQFGYKKHHPFRRCSGSNFRKWHFSEITHMNLFLVFHFNMEAAALVIQTYRDSGLCELGCLLLKAFRVKQKIVDVQCQDSIFIIIGRHNILGDDDFFERIIDFAKRPDFLRPLGFIRERIG